MDDPKLTRHRLLRALNELIERLRIDVLVIEDLQWADPGTLEWLLTLTSVPVDLSIVLTYRPMEVPIDSLLRRLTSRQPAHGMALLRVTLEPLDVVATRELIGSMLDTEDVSDEFASFLHEHVEGNPLAAEESIHLLRERRDIVRQNGRWARRALRRLAVSPRVRDSVLERLAGLSPEARDLLHAAAVLGEPARENLLGSVAGLDHDAVRRGVQAAIGSGLLREVSGEQLTIRHALDSAALSETIVGSERRELHHRAALALDQGDHPPLTQLCRHLLAAGDLSAWSRYAETAADRALESGDDHGAITLLLRLTEVVSGPPGRIGRLACKLGRATVHRAEALPELETKVRDTLTRVLADVYLSTSDRGEVRLWLGWLMFQNAEFRAGREHVLLAVGELDQRPARAARAMMFLASPEALPDLTAERHLAWLEQATALIPQVGSPSEQRVLLIERALRLLDLGDEAGWQAAEQIPAPTPQALEMTGNVEGYEVIRGLLNLAQHAIDWGRYADARVRVVDVLTDARAARFERVEEFAEFDIALLDLYAGVWDGLSDRLARFENAPDRHPVLRLAAHAMLGFLDVVTGARSQGELRLRAAARESGITDAPALLAAEALGRLHLLDGRPARALALTDPIMATASKSGLWMVAHGVAPIHVLALIGTGETSRAEALTTRLEQWVAGRSAPIWRAAVALCRGAVAQGLGDYPAAELSFSDAADSFARLPRPYDEHHARELEGRSRLAAGKVDEAVSTLRRTEKDLRELGATADADRVAGLLRQHGVGSSRAWRGGSKGYGDQLSPRELEVVALVAKGMTNKEVGDALYLSPKTVGIHLSRAMRKFGVNTRTAAAIAAIEGGVIPAE